MSEIGVYISSHNYSLSLGCGRAPRGLYRPYAIDMKYNLGYQHQRYNFERENNEYIGPITRGPVCVMSEGYLS